MEGKKWTPMIHQRDPRDEVLEWVRAILVEPHPIGIKAVIISHSMRDQMVNRIDSVLTKGGSDADRLRQVQSGHAKV